MSVKRRDLVRHLEKNGFHLLREGANHSIYSNGMKVIPVKRHKQLDRITAKAEFRGQVSTFNTNVKC